MRFASPRPGSTIPHTFSSIFSLPAASLQHRELKDGPRWVSNWFCTLSACKTCKLPSQSLPPYPYHITNPPLKNNSPPTTPLFRQVRKFFSQKSAKTPCILLAIGYITLVFVEHNPSRDLQNGSRERGWRKSAAGIHLPSLFPPAPLQKCSGAVFY